MKMDDNSIVELYWERNENAIEETQKKYGRYCYSIAFNILNNQEDAEESVNDTYLNAWSSMPPQRPNVLSAFLGRITRNISLNKWKCRTAEKRGGGQADIVLDELQDCVPSKESVEEEIEVKELAGIIDKFLRGLPKEERNIFLCRYWYMDSIADICKQFGYGESKVKMKLLRTRKKLMEKLEKEGVRL